MWQSESVRRRCSCAQRGWSSSSSSSFSSRQPVRTADFGGQSRLQGLVLFLVRVKIYIWCCVAYQLFASWRVCLFFLLPGIYALLPNENGIGQDMARLHTRIVWAYTWVYTGSVLLYSCRGFIIDCCGVCWQTSPYYKLRMHIWICSR